MSTGYFAHNERGTALYRSPPEGGYLRVTGSGAQRVSRSVVDRRLSSFAVVLVEQGSGFLETQAVGRLTVRAPALFWLLPQRRHSYGPDENGWSERWALFEGSLAADFLRLRLIAEAAPLVGLRDLGEMRRLFQTLHDDLLEDSPLGQASASATLHRIAVGAARQTSEQAPRESGHDIQQIVEALRERALDDVDLGDFAREFRMSPATLRRRFVAMTGLPPKAFQLRVRLDKAKEMLATSDTAIEAIATALGFEDPFYFSRLFRNREGCTPSEFRARHFRA